MNKDIKHIIGNQFIEIPEMMAEEIKEEQAMVLEKFVEYCSFFHCAFASHSRDEPIPSIFLSSGCCSLFLHELSISSSTAWAHIPAEDDYHDWYWNQSGAKVTIQAKLSFPFQLNQLYQLTIAKYNARILDCAEAGKGVPRESIKQFKGRKLWTLVVNRNIPGDGDVFVALFLWCVHCYDVDVTVDLQNNAHNVCFIKQQSAEVYKKSNVYRWYLSSCISERISCLFPEKPRYHGTKSQENRLIVVDSCDSLGNTSAVVMTRRCLRKHINEDDTGSFLDVDRLCSMDLEITSPLNDSIDDDQRYYKDLAEYITG